MDGHDPAAVTALRHEVTDYLQRHAVDGANLDDAQLVVSELLGNAVRQAPSLCRMTSSVLGGIAARNSDGPVTVLLEERIAVGDPGCRVVVQLQDEDPGGTSFGHRYPKPVA